MLTELVSPTEKSQAGDHAVLVHNASPAKTGNRCGHNPEAPRPFIKPEMHKARPKILTCASEVWRNFYNAPKAYFVELRFLRASRRQQRSESREAVMSIAQVLLHYVELASLRVGVPYVSKDGFCSLTIEFLAEKAGLSLKRAKRAIALLKRAGYLTLIERFDIKKDELSNETKFIGLAAVKCLTASFFKACGIDLVWLAAQRKLARKRLKKQLISHREEMQKSSDINMDFMIKNLDNPKAHLDFMKKLLKESEEKEDQRRINRQIRQRSLAREPGD